MDSARWTTLKIGPAGILFALAASGLLVTAARCVQAEDWMFRRSYYSHALPPEHVRKFPPPERRTAYRPAIAGTTPGFAIRGVHRYNRIQQGQGRHSDVTIYRQDWFELEP